MAPNVEPPISAGASSCIAKVLSIACAAIAILQLAGCAGAPKQAFNRAANADIKVIGLLEPDTADEYVVANLGHPGMGFGLIGGLIAAADNQSKTAELTQKLKSRSFDLRKECMAALATELTQTGYTAKPVAVKREKPGFLPKYDALDNGVDAYLDVSCSAGYLTAGPAVPYLPNVTANARMVKRATKEVVYQEVFSYGFENRYLKAVSISADAAYNFADFSALTNDDARALEGIRKGIPLVARRLVQGLGAGPNPVPVAALTAGVGTNTNNQSRASGGETTDTLPK